MVTYSARIVFGNDNETYNNTKCGFDNVIGATKWIAGKLSWIMLNWAEVDPNGITVVAEVYNDEIGFSDMYELKCGI